MQSNESMKKCHGCGRILPGMEYRHLPQRGQVEFAFCRTGGAFRLKAGKAEDLSKALVRVFQGVSPVLAREIAGYATRYRDISTAELTDDITDRLFFFCGRIRKCWKKIILNRPLQWNTTESRKEFSFWI